MGTGEGRGITDMFQRTVLKPDSPQVSHYSGTKPSTHTDHRSGLKKTGIHQDTIAQSHLSFWAPGWLAQCATVNGFNGFIQSATQTTRRENSLLPPGTSPCTNPSDPKHFFTTSPDKTTSLLGQISYLTSHLSAETGIVRRISNPCSSRRSQTTVGAGFHLPSAGRASALPGLPHLLWYSARLLSSSRICLPAKSMVIFLARREA